MAEAWTRESECLNAFGRTGLLRVSITDANGIGVLTPPGDFADLTVVNGDLFQQHVTAAVLEASRRSAGLSPAVRYDRVHDLLDYQGEPRRLGVAARDGWLNISVPGWVKALPDDGEQLAESIRMASAVARRQERRS